MRDHWKWYSSVCLLYNGLLPIHPPFLKLGWGEYPRRPGNFCGTLCHVRPVHVVCRPIDQLLMVSHRHTILIVVDRLVVLTVMESILFCIILCALSGHTIRRNLPDRTVWHRDMNVFRHLFSPLFSG